MSFLKEIKNMSQEEIELQRLDEFYDDSEESVESALNYMGLIKGTPAYSKMEKRIQRMKKTDRSAYEKIIRLD